MRRLFVFDVDNTLGWKTPSFAAVSTDNATYLREIAKSSDNLLTFATGRPRSQAIRGMQHGRISPSELPAIFRGSVYEDGLFVQVGSKTVYDAVNEASPKFRELKNVFFGPEITDFFKTHGFLLVPGKVVRQVESHYELTDYAGNVVGNLEVPDGMFPLYQQGNDVRETYKAPEGFANDDVNAQKSTFEKVSRLTTNYLESNHPGWRDTVQLETWEDAVEIYPKLKGNGDVFIKGLGIGRVMQELDLSSTETTKAYICCDGRNDISLVRWAASNFQDYQAVCPSNVSPELKRALEQGKFKHVILEEDCTKLAKGLEKVLQN